MISLQFNNILQVVKLLMQCKLNIVFYTLNTFTFQANQVILNIWNTTMGVLLKPNIIISVILKLFKLLI